MKLFEDYLFYADGKIFVELWDMYADMSGILTSTDEAGEAHDYTPEETLKFITVWRGALEGILDNGQSRITVLRQK